MVSDEETVLQLTIAPETSDSKAMMSAVAVKNYQESEVS